MWLLYDGVCVLEKKEPPAETQGHFFVSSCKLKNTTAKNSFLLIIHLRVLPGNDIHLESPGKMYPITQMQMVD